MSNAINPRDVLLYLNELGYTNITAQQLKAFIKGRPWMWLIFCRTHIFLILDLKKLVKYEQRLENKENDQSRSFNHEDVYSILHSTTTIASKGKEVQKKGNTITVEVKKISKENGQMTVGSELVNKESGFSDQCCCNQENKQEDISENVSADSVRRSKSCGKLSAKSVVSKPNIKAKASCKFYSCIGINF